MVVTGSADGLIRLWDANSGQCLRTFDNDTNSPVCYAAFTPSSTFLLSATLTSTIRIYNIHTSKVLKTFRHPSYVAERYPCPAVVFARPTRSPASRSRAGGNGEGDGDGMEVEVEVDGVSNGTSGRSARSGKQGNGGRGEAWVGIGSENGRVVIWDAGSREVVGVLEGHQRPIFAIAVHPDGRRIATGSLEPEKVINIWEFDEGDEAS